MRSKIELIERIPNVQDFFILGDTSEGNIYLLSKSAKKEEDQSALRFFSKSVTNELSTKYLGTISIPNTITYLSHSCFFLGILLEPFPFF